MNLDRCTPGQREIITTLEAPLMVAAGAGSGKTFTLTQRIVGALLPHDGKPAELDSIDQVLAITFTKKAAAELKSRIKTQLLAEGLREQALAVDGAWVSTIHGMASRILRDHALEVGVDPAFEVISESRSEELRAAAADSVARAVKADPDPLMRELLASGDLLSETRRGGGIVDQALRILARLEAMPEGFEGLRFAVPKATPGQLMRELLELGYAFQQTAAAWGSPTATERKCLDALDKACVAAQNWLEQAHRSAFDDPEFDAESFCEAFYAFPATSAKFHAKKDDADFFAMYRSDYARLSQEVESSLSYRRLKPLVRFARMISDEFARLKGPSHLDNTDLLTQVAYALRAHPEIAQTYRDQFKLIMIDEFQDTDKLQVSIISALAQPGLSNVCTVGDAQQSIYRFRGADVNVFFEYRDALRDLNPRARFVSLPDNFRSHGDVLALVDTVFSQQQVFGSEFLHLEPRAALNATPDPLFASHSRIRLDFVHYKKSTAAAKGVSRNEATNVAARHIAEHFADLKQRGARAGEMALLLGGMSHAAVYAAALREQGLESVVSGGSVFASSAEAQLVSSLLRYAVNTYDEPALFAILVSPLFAISDDALLALTSSVNEQGDFVTRPLARGFTERDHALDASLSENDVYAVNLARDMLGRFVTRARRGGADQGLRLLFVESGLLDRMEKEGSSGLAAAGNVAKALQLVSEHQRGATGIAEVSRAFDDHLRCSKEAPGSLSTVESDFVRIMTVHASKGLEFPHVAIADMGTGVANRDALLVENVGACTYAAMEVTPSGDMQKVVKTLRGFEREDELCVDPALAQAPGEMYTALDDHMRQQTLSEAQRLLYVAFTRASRSLYLSYVSDSNPVNGYEKEGIYRDLYEALGWDTETDKSVSMVDYGGSAPARVTLEYLKTPDDLSDAVEAEVMPAQETGGGAVHEPGFVVPLRDLPHAPLAFAHSFGREDVFSYSSLSRNSPTLELPEDVGELDEDALMRGADDDETALGLAFHSVAQRAVIMLNAARTRGVSDARLVHPGLSAAHAQARARKLTDDQARRLDIALDRWFGCDLAHEVSAYPHLMAEAPFMVIIPQSADKEEGQSFFLEGEIDLLASEGDGHACLIDYKTGGYSFETTAYLHEKHLLQAQCYAYALLCAGFKVVEAHFVRVEQEDPDDPSQPQVVSYRFNAGDADGLAQVICAARA